jgi:hypothetical protein
MKKTSLSSPVWSSLILLALASGAATSANASPLPPMKTLCGSIDAKGKTFMVIDFEVQYDKARGTAEDKFAASYNNENFPIPDFRLISLGNQRFRIGTQILAREYFEGQYIAYLTIFEEQGSKLFSRYTTVLAANSLESPFSYEYEIPGNQGRIACHSVMASKVSNAETSPGKTPRKPARIPDSKTKRK